jgi:cytochrome P450
MLGRQNLLAMWEEDVFDLEFSYSRVFLRKVFLCNSPEAVQFAFSHKNASFERKSPQMRHALEPLLGDGLFVSDGAIWRQRRRIVAPVVHISRLASFVPIMVEAAQETGERWEALEGRTIDLAAETAQLTAEIICRTIFGRELGRDHARAVVQGFSDYQRNIGSIDLLSLLGLPDWIPRWHRWHRRATRRATERIDAVLDDIIAHLRQRRGSESDSVVGRLIDARDDETGMGLDAKALRNEAAVLFMAGHETTANALAWTWFLLSQAPEVEARLHAELDSVLGRRPVTLADVPKLVYTRAVFDEALRLYPPVPILPRETVKEETFNDVPIPKGSILLVVPWLLHRHKKLWDKPDQFFPERFLPENAARISKFAYIPFSVGPRICAGMSFGLTEAILCLATLSQRFALRLQPGHEVKPVCRLTLRPEGGLPMKIQIRPSAEVESRERSPLASRCPLSHT